jgi:hypothetical protein
MSWEGHVTCRGRRGMHTGFWVGKREGIRPLRRPICRDVGQRIVLKWIIEK